ncbi:MAG: hypothetical protein ACRBCJ_07020 [Hyphomicrobiaceae bacterium]
MTILKIIGGLILFVLLIVGYFSYELYSNRYDAKFRLTVNVEVDGKIHSGSSVVEVQWTRTISMFRGLSPGYSKKVMGEAVLVDLGKHGVLLTLLRRYSRTEILPKPRHVFDIPMRAFYRNKQQSRSKRSIKIPEAFARMRSLDDEKTKRTLAPDNLPMFVLLPDVRDRDSAFPVNPQKFEQDIAPGVKFISAEIELTRDPITYHLAGELPWFAALKIEEASGLRIGRNFFELTVYQLTGGSS